MNRTRFAASMLAIVSFSCLAATDIAAQNLTQQKGLTTVEIKTSQGIIKIYLPADIREGDVISGTLALEPNGNSEKQKQKALGELLKRELRIGNPSDPQNAVQSLAQQYSTASGTCPIIRQKVSLPFMLQLTDIKKNTTTIEIPLPGQAFLRSAACVIPSHALLASPLRIQGPFDGDISNTSCSIEGIPVNILAESPRQCIISYPADAGGVRQLSINENGNTCTQKVSGVDMSVSAGKLNLKKGESTYIDVAITGLSNLPDTAVLSVNNISTGIVTLPEGNTIITPIIPAKDSIKDTFNKRYDVKSIRTGNFYVNVALALPETGEPIQFDQKPLAEPRRLENEALQIGLHVAIKKLIGDAGGANGQEWNTICDNCRQCIEARLGTWAADLVEKLGEAIIKEYMGKAIDLIGETVKAVGAAKEFFDKISDKADKAENFAKDIEDKIRSGELQMMALKPGFCVKSPYCLISGTIFYNPKTGCVFAIIYCQGSKLCCPDAETIATITYCTDEKGMPKDMPQINVMKK